MTVRLTISLPDDLHGALVRVSEASHVSLGSTVRAVLSDVLPRMTKVLDFLGTTPEVTPADVEAVDAWGHELKKFLGSVPPVLGPMVEGLAEGMWPDPEEPEK